MIETLPKHRLFNAADPNYKQLKAVGNAKWLFSRDACCRWSAWHQGQRRRPGCPFLPCAMRQPLLRSRGISFQAPTSITPSRPPWVQDLVSRHLPELERLKAGLQLRALVDSLDWEGPFAPRKAAGTVLLSAGNVPEIHWEDSLAPPPPPAAGAALGVPQPEGFDLLSGPGLRQQGAPPAAQQQWQQQGTGLGGLAPAALTIPDLSSSMRLPAASQATLARHALLPSLSFGSPSSERPPPAPLQQRPLYPELAELEPPAPPVEAALGGLALSSSAAQQQQQQPAFPQPSPYGELQLGPQEMGVTGVQPPTQPLPPDATCCEPGPPPPPHEQALVAAPPRNGVAEVKRLQQIRDVHVSVALMDEFMRWAAGPARLPCPEGPFFLRLLVVLLRGRLALPEPPWSPPPRPRAFAQALDLPLFLRPPSSPQVCAGQHAGQH